MRETIRSPGVASGFDPNFACKSDHIVQCACRQCVRTQEWRHCSFDVIANLRLELVVDGTHKYNHGLGDYCAVTIPVLVHSRVLSSRSHAVAMTILADAELRRNKLVLRFLTHTSCPKTIL